MRLSTRVASTTLAAAALATGMAPAAGAATAADRPQRGNLLVCVQDLHGRDAEITVTGRTDRTADTDGGCTMFSRLRTGLYDVELDAPRGCDDDDAQVIVRRNRTSVVVFDADCRRWRHFDGDRPDWRDRDGDERRSN